MIGQSTYGRSVRLVCRMARSVFTPLVLACALVMGAGTMPASAMELVAGGYGADLEPYAPSASLAMQNRDFASSASVAGLTLDFTPRASGSLFNPRVETDADSSLSLSFGVQDRYSDQLRLDTIGLSNRTDDPSHGLAIGGALSFNDWQFTGSVGRTNLLGNDADVFAAGIGYGRVNARLVYGHVPRMTSGGNTGDVLMLSTDLAAWSWLTLEGDVAVSDSLATEPLTVGRVGVRLNF